MRLESIVKKSIKDVFRKSGYDIVQYQPEFNHPFPILDVVLQDRMTDSEFFFVQVGANDGVLDDPLYELVRRHHLAGLLIEPLPDLFEKLKFNYKEEPQLLFENVAVLSKVGTVLIHRVRSDADVPYHWHGIASFVRENLLKEGIPSELIEEVAVQGSSLQCLLKKHQIEKVSLLQIDTEGYDSEVIKSAFDAGIFPEIINYEHCWLAPRTRYECKKMLYRQGYQFIEAGKDTLAIRVSSGMASDINENV